MVRLPPERAGWHAVRHMCELGRIANGDDGGQVVEE
jgi:hypothetical protein